MDEGKDLSGKAAIPQGEMEVVFLGRFRARATMEHIRLDLTAL